MAIEAPLSRYKKNNMLIMTGLLLLFGIWFYYDGYRNQTFIDKHTNADGTITSTLKFNRQAWPFFVVGGAVMAIRFFLMRNKKVVADEQQLVVDKTAIPFAAIEKVNKTNFDKKGYFVLTYSEGGQSRDITLSERTYDNLAAVLDHTVAKIK